MITDPHIVDKKVALLDDVELAVYRAIDNMTETFTDNVKAPAVIAWLEGRFAPGFVQGVIQDLLKKGLLVDNGNQFQTIRAALSMPRKRSFKIESIRLTQFTVTREVEAHDMVEALEMAKAVFKQPIHAEEKTKSWTGQLVKATPKGDPGCCTVQDNEVE